MLTNEEKYDVLSSILSSKVFSKSTTANMLLKFLVDSSVNHIELSALIIGQELFGSKYEPEKSEANARVNIYHLRKKLQKYYDTEGRDDAIFVSIETGQYGVSFKKKAVFKKKRYVGIIAAFLFVLITICFFFYPKTFVDKVWNDSFINGRQTTLFLSPVFGYHTPTIDGRYIYHRDLLINSEKDFHSAFDTLKNVSMYRIARHNYVTFEDAATIKHFAKLFSQNNSDFAVRKSVDFTFNDIKEQNNIYLSPMRYKTVFRDVFNELAKNVQIKQYGVNNHVFTFKVPGSDRDSTIALSSNSKSYEHAIAAKFKGGNNTNQMMFFADHGIGLSGVAEFFCNQDSLQKFSQNVLSETDEFVAIFYVSGKERTNLKLDMVFFDNNK